jgi:hypothetical protein
MAITLSDFLGTRETGQTHPAQCSCPACSLLNCIERPRFFAGQLISETDLNSEIDYILAKQRLHNRYLHGTGTVCGLEVVCNNCDGYVTVNPGYAISPCGDDIIVCQQQAFDVIGAINACCNSRKSKTNCDPYRPSQDPGCTGLEERWCITVKYLETPTQAVTPLRNPAKSTCTCGTCGATTNGKKSGSACGCGAPVVASPAAVPVQCEPTRVLESYQLGIVPDPGTCDSPAALFGDTLFANLLQCLAELTSFTSQLSPTSLGIVALAAGGTLPGSGTSNANAYAACCQLRGVVLKIFNGAAGITDCAAVMAFQAAVCVAPNAQQAQGSDPQYLQGVQDNMVISFQALFDALRECICHNLLPPCPPDPIDDRLILACLTIKDGKIIDICNFGCRRFAGAFPSFFYWLSAIPIVPVIKKIVDDFCCKTNDYQPQRPGVAAFRPMMAAGVAAGPVAAGAGAAAAGPVAVNQLHPLAQTLMDSNFALPKMFVQHLGDFAQKFTASNIAASAPLGQLSVATLVGMNSKDAVQALGMHNVSYEERAVNSRADIPLSARAFVPFATQGDHVVLFESNGSVIDAQSAPPVTSPQAMAELRSQIESLRSEVETLKSNAAQPKKK